MGCRAGCGCSFGLVLDGNVCKKANECVSADTAALPFNDLGTWVSEAVEEKKPDSKPEESGDSDGEIDLARLEEILEESVITESGDEPKPENSDTGTVV